MKIPIAKVGEPTGEGVVYTEEMLRAADETNINYWFDPDDMTLYLDDGKD